MEKTGLKSKKLLILSLVMVVTLFAIGFTMSAFAEDGTDGYWTFTSDAVKDPLYIQKHFTALPRAFEAEMNLPDSLGSASPIIANWTGSDTRDAFGFQITASGTPKLYYYQNAYDAANSKTVTTKYMSNFKTVLPKNQWVRVTVTNEIESGSAVYKLYVDGVFTETSAPTDVTGIADFDAVYSQSIMRELSIGNDGLYHFKGKLRNVAVYENALTAADAAKTAKEHKESKNTNLLAYYDATMDDNADKLFKDQTGNGHDAKSAFFERKTALKDYAYSFAFIGDTQFLVEKDATEGTSKYAGPIYDWIVQNVDEKNIQRVFGLGDITDDNGKNVNEWEHAIALHEKLENATNANGGKGIPYSIVPGNHDDYASNADRYNSYFSKVEFFTNTMDGTFSVNEEGSEGRIENYYSKFEVGEHKYMVVALEYGAKDEVLEWAGKAVAENYDRKVIVITHSLYNAEGEWAQRDTSAQTTTSKNHKDLNNGIEIWNEFISQHSNIIIAAAGHISADVIKAGQSVGVNGNVVNTFLINPQGFDKATGYDTGMVAMFYFSEDGSEVQVEYVSTTKTLRAQANDPTSDDILYHENNLFSFKTNEVADGYTYTNFGPVPNSEVGENKFAIFSEGKFISTHSNWSDATGAVASLFGANRNANVQLVFLDDYTNNGDAFNTKAASYANGKLTIDLGGHTYVRGSNGTFLSLNIGDETDETAPSNIVIRNGYLRTNGGCFVANSITNKAYKEEKVWNLTFEGVTLGYNSLAAYKGLFYQAWTNSAGSDASQLGTKTNMTFNNCTFDLKTNADDIATAHTLFKLEDDNSGVDKIDVTVKINGGKILSDIDHLKNKVTLYTLNAGSDSVIFGEYNGSYTKLVTHTTAKGYAHYNSKLTAVDGDRCFVEISDNGTEAVYELRSIAVKSGELNTTVDVSANAKYLSVVDYPFFVFDKTGTIQYATDSLYNGGGAMSTAIDTVLANEKDTAYIVMRDNYALGASENYSDLAKANGTVIFDLGGYALTSGSNRDKNDYTFNSEVKGDVSTNGHSSYFVVRNGKVETYASPIIRFSAYNGSKAKEDNEEAQSKLMSWTFEGVTFGLVSGSTYDRFFNVSNSKSATLTDEVYLEFKDCIFDFETVKPSGAFYVFRTNFADGTHIKADVRVKGGKIIAQDLANVYFDNLDTHYGSTLSLGKGSDGEYIKVELPKDKEFGFQIDSKTFGNITKKTESGADASFILFETVGSKKVYGIGVESDYGSVPPEYSDENAYPWFVFDASGIFQGAYSTLLGGAGTAMYEAINTVLNNGNSGTVNIVLRRNYEIGASETYSGDLEAADGSVVIDLGGNALTESSSRASGKWWFDSESSTYCDSNFTIKNGTIKTCKNAILCLRSTTKSKSVSWTFNNVKFGLVDGATYDRFFHIRNASGSATLSVELNFTDCEFDFKTVKPSGNFYVFRTNFVSSTKIKADIKINGGKILADNPTSQKIYLDNFSNATGSTMYFGAGSDGEFLKIVLPKGQTFGIYVEEPVAVVATLYNLTSNITKYTEKGTKIKFYKESSSDTEDVYSFCFDTKYGTAPAKYEDENAYPFFIFNSSGTFKGARDRWGLDNDPSALSSSKTAGYVVLLRRDYTNSDGQYNNLSHTKDLTIDLNGFTFKNTAHTLFMAQKKPQSGNEQNTKITLINGTVILGSFALVKMDTSTSTTSGKYGFDFTFENLTVKMTDNAATAALVCQDEFAAGDPVQYCNFTFNNCVFDLSNAKKAMTLFDVSDSCCKVTAVMNGGEIITSTYGVTLWKNYESAPDTVTAHAESTLTFVKDGGSYTTLKVPDGVELPIATVNNGTLYYVRTSVDGKYVIYSLAEENPNVFTPKSSITLSSELVYNVYVPVSTILKSFELDNVPYTDLSALTNIVTLSDGKEYYHFEVELPSAEAARDILLRAVVTIGGKDYNGAWTMSIPKYAKKLISGGINTEKQLATDVLAYIRAAYNYEGFKSFNTADEITRVNTLIDSIIGEYNPTPVSSGVTNVASPVKSVTLNLDAKPTIRFYVSDTTVEFFAGGKKLNTVAGTDGTYGTYVELDVYAYALCETITYTGGSYHISSFVDGAAGQPHEALVKAFVKYTESAAAYRASVIGSNK